MMQVWNIPWSLKYSDTVSKEDIHELTSTMDICNVDNNEQP